ncbi:MAG: hypothetical protein HS116_02175 [Planctomycetes bacterium]|nr:hypothetical protein [Planctomycetota bacterium]
MRAEERHAFDTAYSVRFGMYADAEQWGKVERKMQRQAEPEKPPEPDEAPDYTGFLMKAMRITGGG